MRCPVKTQWINSLSFTKELKLLSANERFRCKKQGRKKTTILARPLHNLVLYSLI